MEYKIFKFLRHKFQIPLLIRYTLWIIFIFISSIPIILPIYPWSSVMWVILLVIWILLIIPWDKIRHVVKIRKGILFLIKNYHRKHIFKQKMRNIKSHVKNILRNK